MREIIFVVVAAAILGVLIWLSYKSKRKRFPSMFAVALLCLCAFYLFQYGNLSSFSLKAFSTEASFIREKKEKVIQDVKDIDEAKAEILAIKKQLEETIALASPPSLKLTGRGTEILDTGYRYTLQFTPSKNEPLGSIEFIATVDDNSDARILDFWPSIKGGAFSAGDDSKLIEKNGKQARLSYALLSVGVPTIVLTLSGNARIRIEGNYLKNTIVVSP